MDIPYTTTDRPDTGVYNGKLGMWLFIASEAMLFGGLFSAYVLLRVNDAGWPYAPDLLNVPAATANTAILIASGITMVMAWVNVRLGDLAKCRVFLGLTIVLGMLFLGIKSFEYVDKYVHGHYPSTDVFYGIYFALTGLHFMHVLGGVIAIAWHAGPGARLWRDEPAQYANRIEVTGLYWHFVDLVWIILFPVLYLT